MRGSIPHNPTADHIVIDDIWFYKESRGKYYLGNVPKDDGKRHPVRAHVYVWEKYYGAVPEGFSVHHIDKNPRNNDISNLTLTTVLCIQKSMQTKQKNVWMKLFVLRLLNGINL